MQFTKYDRMASATVLEIARSLQQTFGATFARPTKRHVALAATRVWPELYGRRREFILQEAARLLNINVQYRGHDAARGCE